MPYLAAVGGEISQHGGDHSCGQLRDGGAVAAPDGGQVLVFENVGKALQAGRVQPGQPLSGQSVCTVGRDQCAILLPTAAHEVTIIYIYKP